MCITDWKAAVARGMRIRQHKGWLPFRARKELRRRLSRLAECPDESRDPETARAAHRLLFLLLDGSLDDPWTYDHPDDRGK